MICLFFSPRGTSTPTGSGPHRDFVVTLGRTTLGRTPLGEWSALRGDLYLTTQNTRDISMPRGGIRTQNPNKRVAAHPRLW